MLHLLYPGASIVPNKQIDTFWHYHILDTMKYATDCELIFGHFLHHFPYFGLRGKEDAENLKASFQLTLNMFAQTFQETPEMMQELFAIKADCSTGCDSGPGSCHISCYSSCHSQPTAQKNELLPVKIYNDLRPELKVLHSTL